MKKAQGHKLKGKGKKVKGKFNPPQAGKNLNCFNGFLAGNALEF